MPDMDSSTPTYLRSSVSVPRWKAGDAPLVYVELVAVHSGGSRSGASTSSFLSALAARTEAA